MKEQWEKKYLLWSILAFSVIALSILFHWALTRWDVIQSGFSIIFQVLTPFVLGLVVAYLLTPVLNFLEKKALIKLAAKLFPNDGKKAAALSRVLGVIISLGLFTVIVTNLFMLIVTQLYSNMSLLENLIVGLPTYFTQVTEWVEELLQNNPEMESIAITLLGNLYTYLMEWTQTSLMPNINQFIASVSTGVINILNGIVNLFIGLVVSVYVMYNKETLAAQFKKLLYSLFKSCQVEMMLSGIGYIHRAFGGFISGKILDSLIIGIICFIGMSLLKLPSPTLIAIIIGITNIIPFFGPFIGGIPCAFLILLESPIQALIFILFVIALQQFDGNILGPKILGNSTGLTGLWVLFAILVGGGLFGFPGMVCGVPVFAVLYAGVKHFCHNQLKRKNLPVETNFYKKE